MQEQISLQNADQGESEPQKRMGCFKKGLLILGGVILFLVVLLWWTFPNATLRYRLTVTVEANGRPVTNSGVWQVAYIHSGCIDVCQVTTRVSGQAFPLELASGRRLWVTLRGQNWSRTPQELSWGWPDKTEPQWLAPTAFGRIFRNNGFFSISAYIHSLWWLQGSRPLAAEAIPQLLYLRDESDPKSFQWVALPADIDGIRVTFISASLELTRDPITKGKNKLFPWLLNEQQLAQTPQKGLMSDDLER